MPAPVDLPPDLIPLKKGITCLANSGFNCRDFVGSSIIRTIA
jgi:hypothetical protein